MIKLILIVVIILSCIDYIILASSKITADDLKPILEKMINKSLTLNGLSSDEQKKLKTVIGVDLVLPNDTACDEIDSNVVNKEQCTDLKFFDNIHKCCYVSVKIKSYQNYFCKKIANTKQSLKDVKNSFKHSKIKIDCNSFFIDFSKTILPFIFTIFIILF